MNTIYNQENTERIEGDELFSVSVKAGKRIYYFDVKATRANDYYITITESRKRPLKDGGFVIDKHKIHLYKEDFEKFSEGLFEAINYIKSNRPEESEIAGADHPFGEFKQEIPTEEEFFKGL